MAAVWTGEDEAKLLDCIEDRGFGNWEDVAVLMGRPAAECSQHYQQFYIENPHPEMPSMLLPRCYVKPRPVPNSNEYVNLEQTGRIQDQTYSQSFSLPGFMPYRGEFDVEWCNNAEVLLSNLSMNRSDSHDSLITALKLAVVDRYRTFQKERERRKSLIREYGLLATPPKADEDDKLVIEKWKISQRMAPFMKLMPPQEYDILIQGMQMELELKNRVQKLQEYRTNGIQQFYAAEVFEDLSKELKKCREQFKHKHMQRENERKVPTPAMEASHDGGKSTTVSKEDMAQFPQHRLLAQDEKEFCHAHNIQPHHYLRAKRVLVAESRRVKGALALNDARKALRIDVNKTRKIFDFLHKKGTILCQMPRPRVFAASQPT